VPQINVSGGVMSISVAAPARSNTMGQFRIGPLSPGSYTLMAMSATPNGPRLSGYTNVSVQGIDPVNVTISMSPVLELDGRFVFDETPAASSINVRARSTISTQADSAAVAPSPDGTVKLTGIGRGPYVIDVASLPQDHFLKSARLGDVDVLTDGFRMENPPDRAMDIVVSSKGAMLRGLVRDSGRNAAGGVVVTLVPDEVRRQRQELFRNVTADAAGRYEFRGIPPGSYKVFAWEDIEPKSWLEPAYLRVFEDLGKVVAVAEGSSETLDIIAISPLER
jgi:hypothetical protein